MRPVKTQVVELPFSEVEQAAGVATAGADVTVNPVKAEPPLMAGMVQAMVAVVADAVALAVTAVGTPGVPTLIVFDVAETAPFPLAFLAVMVKL